MNGKYNNEEPCLGGDSARAIIFYRLISGGDARANAAAHIAASASYHQPHSARGESMQHVLRAAASARALLPSAGAHVAL